MQFSSCMEGNQDMHEISVKGYNVNLVLLTQKHRRVTAERPIDPSHLPSLILSNFANKLSKLREHYQIIHLSTSPSYLSTSPISCIKQKKRLVIHKNKQAIKSSDRKAYIHEKWKSSDSLHRQDEEGNHWQIPTFFLRLNSGQSILERRICRSTIKNISKYY